MTVKELIRRLESFTHFRGQDIDMPVYIADWDDEVAEVARTEMHIPMANGEEMYVVLCTGNPEALNDD